jgi:chromate transporter
MILLNLFLIFLKIGIFTFGGGYAMIPFLEKEIVEIKKWITHQEFIDIVAIDAVTPGPIAVNLATFIGYKVHGISGAVIATLGVVLPSLVIVLLIATIFYTFYQDPKAQAVLNGLRPAVIALIAAALFSLIRKGAVIDVKTGLIALIVFISVALLGIHPILMVILAGLFGYLLYYLKLF